MTTVTLDDLRKVIRERGSLRKAAKYLEMPESTLRCMIKRVQAQIDAEKKIEKLLHEAYLALLVVKSGIWRRPDLNACGLAGAAVAVHAVEAAVKEIEEFMDVPN